MVIDIFPLPWDSKVDNHPDILDAPGKRFRLAAAPFGLPANSQFFRPITNGRMQFSASELLMEQCPSSR